MTDHDSTWADLIEKRLGTVEDVLDANVRALAENTAMTAEIRDVMSAAHGFFRFAAYFGRAVVWVGKIAGAGLAVWGVIYAALHGGKTPGG